jgi:hypothetical protein
MKDRSMTSLPRRWVVVAAATLALALFAAAIGWREARSSQDAASVKLTQSD